jgi:hypothetical protein
MVTLTAGVFLLFTSGRGEFYEGGPRVRRPLMKWSAIAESLRNIDLNINSYLWHLKNI